MPIVPYSVAECCDLPDSLTPLVEELRDRLLSIGRSGSHNTCDNPSAHAFATADARGILHSLRTRLDELAPEVAELREALKEANARADASNREAHAEREISGGMIHALADERRKVGALKTDAIVTYARLRTVARFLRVDASAILNAPDARERMKWAAGMLERETAPQ